MRTLLTAFAATTLLGGVALADDPAPVPAPEAPAPDDNKPEDPKPEVKPPEVAPPAAEPAPPPPTASPAPSSSSIPVFDDTPTSTTNVGERTRSGPRIAIELSGAGGKLGDPYVVYRGWTLENGATKGTRLEGQLGGITLAYELTSMSNTQACAAGCVTGSFGSTTFHALELGYHYRFRMIGPLRPFLAATVGGVIGNSGDWAMTSATSKGGAARAAFGLEIPFAGRFYATGMISYRLIITTNPYRNDQLETASKVLINPADEPAGNFAEDAHIIGVNLGVGVAL